MTNKNNLPNDSANKQNKPRTPWHTAIHAIRDYCARHHAKQELRERNEASVARWAMWTAFGTWAAVIVAAGAAVLLIVQLGDNREATVDANRAWFSASNVVVLGADIGAPIHYALIERNFGHGPANNFALAAIDNGFVDAPANNDTSNLMLNEIDMCKGVSLGHSGATLFPDTSPVQDAEGKPAPPMWILHSNRVKTGVIATEELFSRAKRFYTRGCFVYETMGKIGKTQFCEVITLSKAPNGDVIVAENYCTFGNRAE